ncbi:MAG: VWA domain-containing protein [Gammaproteobacteria bacterium]|nr:VWA domain-containing protein [Gammaproteobacteria bacterium]
MNPYRHLAALVACLLLPLTVVADEPANDLILVLDASNSMWGQIQGENKIVIARRAVGELIDGLPEESRVGLVAYGHRREGDCADIETLRDVQKVNKNALKETINAITPKGKTPITASLEAAFALINGDSNTSVILISDGLETCSRDPCQAVRTAKESGLPFVLHVVGFDVAGEDTSQLECAAQAGGGVFLSVEDATQLSEALEVAYEKPATPDGRLIVTATANGILQDAAVEVVDARSGEWVAGGRTYISETTNPRHIPLDDGTYKARIVAVGINGRPAFDIEFDIADGSSVEKTFNFSSGELSVLVTRNDELSDATVRVLSGGASKQIAAGRTYVGATTNPRVLTVPAGTYDIEVKSVELKGDSKHRFEGVVVNGNERTELQHDYASGTLSVEIKREDLLIDAVVQIYDSNGRSVVGRRTYANNTSNPVSFELAPGKYSLRVSELRGERKELDAEVTAAEATVISVDMAQ